jgi:hypothetical protein
VGARHEKTGQRKELRDSSQGTRLSLLKVQSEVSRRVVSFEERKTPVNESIFHDNLLWLLSEWVPNGKRHYSLVLCCHRLKEFGADPQTALWWLQHVNARFDEPKPDDELERIVQSCFTR